MIKFAQATIHQQRPYHKPNVTLVLLFF